MGSDTEQYEALMDAALALAAQAEALGDVPIGAVIAREGRIIASAHNRRIIDRDPTGHAEMLAIRAAAAAIGDWRLTGCSLVVTLEPCCMCAGAIVVARLDRVVYGADDPKAGAVRSLFALCSDGRLNHVAEVVPGIRAGPCGEVLTRFFRRQREMGKK
jgi:tRNA(adenine34) deaminase